MLSITYPNAPYSGYFGILNSVKNGKSRWLIGGFKVAKSVIFEVNDLYLI